MSLIESLGAAGAVLRGAQGVIRELRRPRGADAAFAAVLREQLQRNDPAATQRMTLEINEQSARFVALRDADGDGLLTLDESGLTREEFLRLDTDGDGRLSAAEVARPALDALQPARNG
ncbi:MAG TPA: hypothetical protein PKI11_08695 [Candidatus Hydrogenedentes bacterium]|nr:hypothetical protein [Candidatus Hydrogenedentota bacterium]HNT86327.1 hypothetical protein [Candidatus Hydrogenedentota bacterium]